MRATHPKSPKRPSCRPSAKQSACQIHRREATRMDGRGCPQLLHRSGVAPASRRSPSTLANSLVDLRGGWPRRIGVRYQTSWERRHRGRGRPDRRVGTRTRAPSPSARPHAPDHCGRDGRCESESPVSIRPSFALAYFLRSCAGGTLPVRPGGANSPKRDRSPAEAPHAGHAGSQGEGSAGPVNLELPGCA